MGRLLHGSARTPTAKCRKHPGILEARMGPKPVLTVLSAGQEAIATAFPLHPLLALDDCLYALQATIPHAPLAVGAALLLSAPRHQPPAFGRRWAKPTKK